jgi:hypothetical protein
MAVAIMPSRARAGGPDGAPSPPAQPSEFVLRAEAIRRRLRLTQKRFALDYAGCSPQEYNRFVRGGRGVTRRVEEHLLVYFPELRQAYLRSVLAKAEREGIRPVRLPGKRRRKPVLPVHRTPGEGGMSPG